MDAFKPLKLEDKERVTAFFRAHPPVTSELTFTNLFMWQHVYHPRWTVVEGCLVFKCGPGEEPGDQYFLPPVGERPLDAVQALCRVGRERGEPTRFERVPEELAQRVRRLPGLDCEVKLDRNNSDYLYSLEKLLTLTGGKLKSKRKLYQRFRRAHPDFKVKTCETVDVEDCRAVQDKWYGSLALNDDPSLELEHEAVQRIFDHHDELDFEGVLIFVGGEPVAFTFGEALNPTTVVIHVEKADLRFKGAYQAVSVLFLEMSQCAKGKTHVNREQDLGLPGLRKAKLSYDPEYLVHKYVVREKGV